jgi:hypothetical protein
MVSPIFKEIRPVWLRGVRRAIFAPIDGPRRLTPIACRFRGAQYGIEIFYPYKTITPSSVGEGLSYLC